MPPVPAIRHDINDAAACVDAICRFYDFDFAFGRYQTPRQTSSWAFNAERDAKPFRDIGGAASASEVTF